MVSRFIVAAHTIGQTLVAERRCTPIGGGVTVRAASLEVFGWFAVAGATVTVPTVVEGRLSPVFTVMAVGALTIIVVR
jgi:uncharacterized membrane-anchored protein